jgi:hypothetical protein
MPNHATAVPVTLTLTLAPEQGTLHDIFTTAIEGGINYWCRVARYHWSVDDKGDERDYAFFAEVLEADGYDDEDEDEDETPPNPPRHRIDAEVILRGLVAYASMPSTERRYPLREKAIRLLMGGEVADAVDYDAEDADCIVQMGLFGKLVYG